MLGTVAVDHATIDRMDEQEGTLDQSQRLYSCLPVAGQSGTEASGYRNLHRESAMVAAQTLAEHGAGVDA